MKTDSKNIFCSVSAGYSSVMMAVKMKEYYPNHNIINVMANTSKERIESLEFMNECDKHFGLNLVWVESIISQEKGVGSSFKVVKYEDLCTDGSIFREGIKKYGIPSVINKWCNRELKVIPMTKYFNSLYKGYSVAVGIRADEIDRVRKDYKENNVFYPLLDNGITTRDRNKFWKEQPIKIKIPAFKGNCDLCFEKSNRKLLTIINEDPELAIWWDAMIKEFGNIKLKGKDSYNELMDQNNGMTFYRKYTTIEQLVELASQPFRKATDEYIYESDLFDLEDECGSGCRAF